MCFNLKPGNYIKFIVYRTINEDNMCLYCPYFMGTPFHFVNQKQAKKKVSMVSLKLKILNIAILPIVPIHICLPLSISTRERNGNSRICLMIDAKQKQKKKNPPPRTGDSIFLPVFPFAKNRERHWEIHRILVRDWRGSNPQLPPWQGGALTNWTTIPARCIAYIFFLFHK